MAHFIGFTSCQRCNDGSGPNPVDDYPNRVFLNNFSTDTITDIYYPQIGKTGKVNVSYFYLLNAYEFTTVRISFKSGKQDSVTIGYERHLEAKECEGTGVYMDGLKILSNSIDSSFFSPQTKSITIK